MDSLLEATSLPEFFREQVDRAVHHLHVEVSDTVEFYLVNLLTQFAQARHFHEKNENGEEKALAIQFFESIMANPFQRVTILKKMGDVALYTSGFFADSVYKKNVDLGYVQNMGYSAYSSLSNLMTERSESCLKVLYEELAQKFTGLSDVLAEVKETTHLKSDLDLLKLYDRWLQTGSDRVKNLLQKEGITPNVLVKSRYSN